MGEVWPKSSCSESMVGDCGLAMRSMVNDLSASRRVTALEAPHEGVPSKWSDVEETMPVWVVTPKIWKLLSSSR